MRASRFFISTLKEAPSDAELISHQLMLRAGLIKKEASGLYIWMPLGLKVLRKVEAIVRDEINKSGAIELLMPAVQPAELWQESGRWEEYGAELLRIKDRHQRDFCFGPTHEEVITDIARREINSYKQLPLCFYQIQTKFRDEIRPRFGIIRAREFLMKDAYSFHTDKASLAQTYQTMYEAYTRIFTRLGLAFRAVAADTGAIGGTGSHEFHVLADSGEDAIAFCPDSDYAANTELAEAIAPPEALETPRPLEKIATPGQQRIEDVTVFLGSPAQQCVKTLLVKTADGGVAALLLRGDHTLNPIKASRLELLANPLQFASEEEIRATCGCPPGYLGPLDLPIPVIADRAVVGLSNFVCGANEEGFHYKNVNWERDLPLPSTADIRVVVEGDASPDGRGKLSICRGIEVGHIFQLGSKYSEAMGATFLDEAGNSRVLEMGCYGIGVSRIIGAAIEQGYDERGIIFPAAIAPFLVVIVPLGMQKNTVVKQAAEKLYIELIEAGVDVLLDDRNERAGVLFAESELMGIPHRVVISERGLARGEIEYQARKGNEAQALSADNAATLLQSIIWSA